jgi:DNA-binding NarL/FixJ family response regulator
MRERTARVAASQGLDIICTATGAEALALFENYRGEVRLVVLQAEDAGEDVAALEAQLREIDPDVKVLITTRGDDTTGVLAGTPRLRTPCQTEALECAVVTTLNRPNKD